jgi:hypothetical protein
VPYAGYDLGIKKEVSLIYYNGKGRMLIAQIWALW